MQLRQRLSFARKPDRIERTIGAGGIAKERQAIATGEGSGTNRTVYQSPTRTFGG